MLKKLILIVVLLLSLMFSNISFGQKEINQMKEKKYTLKEDEGIYVEVFDSTNVNPNRYTENNIVFQNDIEFTYSYEHIDNKGNRLLFKDVEREWKFVSKDSIDDSTITQITISVLYGLKPMIYSLPDYNQTVIQYKYLNSKSTSADYSERTGVIENEKNIWLHPPRSKYFQILELNPFPFIKAPYKIGNEWDWSLKIGSMWGDERWKTWEGIITNQYTYKIIGKDKVKTKLGVLECFVIESDAKSSIGSTKLTSYFNEQYGFVKLNYVNIDNSKTNLELIGHIVKTK